MASCAQCDLHHHLDDVLARQLLDPPWTTRPQLGQLAGQMVGEATIASAHWASKVGKEFLEHAGEPET